MCPSVLFSSNMITMPVRYTYELWWNLTKQYFSSSTYILWYVVVSELFCDIVKELKPLGLTSFLYVSLPQQLFFFTRFVALLSSKPNYCRLFVEKWKGEWLRDGHASLHWKILMKQLRFWHHTSSLLPFWLHLEIFGPFR